jgi:hypothetical protein
MSQEREQEIVSNLQAIVDGFTPSEDEPTLSCFGLISRYNATGGNVELIGGEFAKSHGFMLPE